MRRDKRTNGKEEYKKKILIIYHSGAGSTKTISEIYFELLNEFEVAIDEVSLNYDYEKLNRADLIIFAFPIYHEECSKSMSRFIVDTPIQMEERKIFILSTYGLFEGNAKRNFMKKAGLKNLRIIGEGGYRAPASDGALLLPSLGFMYRYEKKIGEKIKNDINFLKKGLRENTFKEVVPRFKLYSILNAPNKFFGQRFAPNIYINKQRCINCNRCINNCIGEALRKSNEEIIFSKENCEHCYKCIHHCPTSAIYLNKKTVNRKKLNGDFYKELKERILREIG